MSDSLITTPLSPSTSAKTPPIVDPKPRRLRKWHNLADHTIDARLADARAHAMLGDAPKAHARVVELGETLRDLMAASRAEFYVDAVGDHMKDFNPATDRRLDPDPGAQTVLRESRNVGHGDQLDELDRAIADARQSLRLAMSGADAKTPLVLWESTRRSKLGAMTRMHASDAQMAIHTLVGTLKVRPEYR